MVTAVRGWPGVGKTTVAAALAHDQVLASAFPDGLLWASIGQNPDLIGQLDIGRGNSAAHFLSARS